MPSTSGTGKFKQFFTRQRQPYRPPDAVKQLRPKLLLQLLDVRGHRRLTDVQQLRRP